MGPAAPESRRMCRASGSGMGKLRPGAHERPAVPFIRLISIESSSKYGGASRQTFCCKVFIYSSIRSSSCPAVNLYIRFAQQSDGLPTPVVSL